MGKSNKICGSDYQFQWTMFYDQVFGLTVDLSQVKFPSKKVKGFNWLVIVSKELGDKPLNTAMAACRKLFGDDNVLQYTDDMDKDAPTNDRDPRRDGSYAICVRDRVEADEENKNLSANDIKLQNMATMTLLERVVLELFYFWKTGKHLDIQKSSTICSGSRNPDGYIPFCNWFDDEFEIDWDDPDSASGPMRARSVVLA